MEIGKLNKRIELWHYIDTENDMYETVKQEQFLTRLWAGINDVTGLKKNNDVVDDVKYDYKIRIRYNKNINETMIIKYQSRTFKINAIVDVNLTHKEMILLCEEVR